VSKARIVLLNKPYGYLSQFTAEGDKPGLSRFSLPSGMYPAGRLDYDSEGLLLLTDDGSLTHRLTKPGGHPRKYWAQVERVPDEKALTALRRGLVLSDGKTMPCKAAVLAGEPELWARQPPIRFRVNVPTAWLELVMVEGRNRQVRRMTAAVGHPTLRLVRSEIGGIGIGGLAPGKWRWVDKAELKL
jgi:23S rRNA pseudouridine2457 synthase